MKFRRAGAASRRPSRSTAASSVSRRRAKWKRRRCRPGRGVGVEARARHRRDPDLRHQVAGERRRRRGSRSPRCRSSRSTRRAARNVRNPARLERRNQEVAALPVAVGELGVIVARQAQRHRGRLLQRRRGAHGQEVVNLADRGRSAAPAPGTSRSASRSRCRSWRCPLIVTVRSRMPSSDAMRDVLGAVVEDVLVDLVGDRHHVPLPAQRGDLLQLGAA